MMLDERNHMVEKLELTMRSAAERGTFIHALVGWSWPGVLNDDAHLRKLTEDDILNATKRALDRGLPYPLLKRFAKSLGSFLETNKNVADALERLDDLMDTYLGWKKVWK
jgi:hypothetical protein